MQKNIQKRFLMILLTVLFTLTAIGAVSAANGDTNLVVNSVSGNSGNTVTLSAHLTRDSYSGGWGDFSGQRVDFYVDGVNVGHSNTGSNGIATVSYHITESPGTTHTIRAEYAGTTGYHPYDPATGSGTLTVNHVYYDTDTDLTLTHSDTPGNQITCTAHVTYQAPGPDPAVPDGLTVTFTANGNPIGTGTTTNGYATCTYTGSSDATIRANFAQQSVGGYVYRSSYDQDDLDTHGTSTSLTVNPTTTTVGNQVTLSSRLTRTSNGNGINGGIIHFFVNGTEVGTATTHTVSGQSGWATFTYTPTISGTKNIQAFFYGLLSPNGGDWDYYRSSSGPIRTLTVNAIPTSLTVDHATGYKGYPTTLRATLIDTAHSNVGVVGRTIDFWVNGVWVGSNTTDSSGVATLIYTITQNAGSSYALVANFTTDGIYAFAEDADTLTVNYIPTSLTLDPANGYKDDPVTFHARLVDLAHTNGIANKIINFYIGSTFIGSNTTDINGDAYLAYTILENVGLHQISAGFGPDPDYQYDSNVDFDWLTVDAIPTNLTVDNLTGNKGQTVNLKATLTDTAHGNVGVSGRIIHFKVNGVDAGTATTDSNGVATLAYPINLVGGTYDIFAEFLTGDEKYNASNGTGSLKVNQSSIYVLTTVNKKNPTVGETITITFKLGNKGPDPANDVVFTYHIPDGMEFVSLETEPGYPAAVYDPATRTVTWTLGTVPMIDPWIKLNLKVLKAGTFDINPVVTTSTYDPTIDSNIQTATVNAVNKVEAATVGMQETGIPIVGLVLALLAVFGGLVMPKRK